MLFELNWTSFWFALPGPWLWQFDLFNIDELRSRVKQLKAILIRIPTYRQNFNFQILLFLSCFQIRHRSLDHYISQTSTFQYIFVCYSMSWTTSPTSYSPSSQLSLHEKMSHFNLFPGDGSRPRLLKKKNGSCL